MTDTHSHTQEEDQFSTKLFVKNLFCVCVCVQLPAWPPSITFWQSSTKQVISRWCGMTCPVSGVVVLNICISSPASSGQGNTDLLQEVMSELAGTSFTCQDPDDGMLGFYDNTE